MEIILFLIYFVFASFLAFYIPGRVILGEQKSLPKIGIFAVSYVLGIVLWGWQGYLFGFLQLRNLSYLYLLIFLGLFIFKRYYSFKIPKISLRKFDWITILMAGVGIIAQIIPYVRNGELSSAGLFFSNYNVVDHVWHATLVEELVRRFPPMEPGMYGIQLTNYHFWFHLVTADLIRVFHLPLFQTQFIGMYGIASILLALLAYVLAKAIYDSKLFLRLFVFFLFFGGNIGALFMLFVTHRFDFSIGWLFEDATKLMDAPGSGFAVIISLAAIYLLFKNKEKIPWKTIGIIGLLFGSLMGFKIYFAIPLILGVFCMSAFNVFKKNFSTLWIFVIASVVFLIQYLPFSAGSGGLFFLPFDIPRGFFAQQGLGLTFLDQRWGIYYAHHNTFRLIEYGVLMSIGYLLAQFGVKLFGLIPLRRTIKTTGLGLYIFLYSTVLASLTLTLFFYQKVGGANIWEFLFPTSLVLAILVALNISLLLSKFNKIIMLVIVGIIIVITIPRWIYSVNLYMQDTFLSGFHGVSTLELKSYEYLKNNTPENSNILLIGQSYAVSFSSLGSVLAERNLFLGGTGVSQLRTPEILERKRDFETVTNSTDVKVVNAVLKKDKIDYVAIYKNPLSKVTTINASMQQVFSNNTSKIFKVE